MQITGAELVKRKERIIMCAFKLFCEKGVENTAIIDIAKSAKVAAVSVYRYFGTKTELCIQAGEVMWHRLVQEITEPFMSQKAYQEKNGYDQIREHLYAFLLLYRHYPDYVQFMSDLDTYMFRRKETLPLERYKYMLEPVKTQMLEAITKGQYDGSVTADTDAEELYVTIWGLMRNFVCRMVIGDRLMEHRNLLGEEQYKTATAIILSALRHGLK